MDIPGEITSPEQLRQLAMSPLGALALSISDWTPLAFLGQAGLLLAEAHALMASQKVAEEQLDVSKEPSEHQELYKAMDTSIEAAHIAFDAAVNAAWQLLWVQESCKCLKCNSRRQRANADLS